MGLLYACEEVPLFPDPGFDFTSDKNVEVRRDTADHYDIVMRMNVPNGVDKIELLNGLSYKVITTINDYKGQTQFDFTYRVDLSSYNVDTTFYYIIKVTDKDARSFNRGMTIKLRRFSIPEIFTNGGDHIGLTSPIYMLRAKITTGMNYIDSIKISFEGKVKKIIVPDKQKSDTIINELVTIGGLEWNKEYRLDISAKDNKGQETVKTLILLRKDLQKPKSLLYYESGVFWGTFYFEYDSSNRLSKMTWDYTRISQKYTYTYTYNDLGMVSRVDWQHYDPYNLYISYNHDKYYYLTGTTQLNYVTSQTEKLYDTGAFVSNTETKYIENVTYNSNGTIKSVVAGANLIDNISYDPGFADGDWVFAEYWYTPYSAIRTQYRQRRIDFQPVFMPTYNEYLPPFTSDSGYMREMINALFFHKYIFGKNERTSNPSYDKESSYTYTTDTEGRIVKIVRSYYDIYQWTTTEYRLNY